MKTASAKFLTLVSLALDIFDLTPASMGRPDVQRRFRELLRDAHPDHGGATDHAARHDPEPEPDGNQRHAQHHLQRGRLVCRWQRG